MSPFDRRLLTRIALRMERDAKAAYEAAGKTDSAKSTRDNVMGDVLDLRDYIARHVDGEDGSVLVPIIPTDEMRAAGATALTEGDPGDLPRAAGRAWFAMITAARPGEKVAPA